MPNPPVRAPENCVLPAPDERAVRILQDHLGRDSALRLTGMPRLHQPMPGDPIGNLRAPPDKPPQHPGWCLTALPGVVGFRILAMINVQEPAAAEAYLRPENELALGRAYAYFRGLDNANATRVNCDLIELWARWVKEVHVDLARLGNVHDADLLHALSTEQRASCVLAAGVESARKCSELVDLFRQMLEQRGVPTFGGYPTMFAHLHAPPTNPAEPHCPAWCQSSLPGERSYLGLAMLAGAGADRAGGEKRFASALLTQWTDWINQRIVELNATQQPEDQANASMLIGLSAMQRAACMLAAMYQLAMNCGSYTANQKKAVPGWLLAAEARVGGLLAQWKQSVPAPLIQKRETKLARVDPRWGMAGDGIAGEGELSDCLHLMLFMFLWHANLGLWQVPLDNPDRHLRRNQFYEALAQVLRYSCTEPALRDTAERVLRALQEMPLLTGVRLEGDRALLLRNIAQLPPCFNIYVGYRSPSVEVNVSQVTHELAQQRIRQIHRLADMVAETFLDIVRLRPVPAEDAQADTAPGFHWGHVAYVASRARFREQKTGKDAVKALIDPVKQLLESASALLTQLTDWIDAELHTTEQPEDQAKASALERLSEMERAARKLATTLTQARETAEAEPRWHPEDDPSALTGDELAACDEFRRGMLAHYEYLLTPGARVADDGAAAGPPPLRMFQLLFGHLPMGLGPPWPGLGADPRPCAMCQIRPH